MARRPHERPEKLCPKCAAAMWITDIPEFGKLWHCGDCRVTLSQGTLHSWRRENEPDRPVRVAETKGDRYLSTKACPECGRPMWALEQPGYGTRYQCEECRLSVLFGGAVARWGRPKA